MDFLSFVFGWAGIGGYWYGVRAHRKMRRQAQAVAAHLGDREDVPGESVGGVCPACGGSGLRSFTDGDDTVTVQCMRCLGTGEDDRPAVRRAG